MTAETFTPTRCTCGQYPDVCVRYGHRHDEPDFEPDEELDGAQIAEALRQAVTALSFTQDEATREQITEALMPFVDQIDTVESFADGGWMTRDDGFAVSLVDGRTFTVTVTRAR